MGDEIPDTIEADFFRAARKNQAGAVRALLAEFPGLISCLKQGNSAVGYVCMQANFGATNDYTGVLRLLLDSKVDANARQNDGVPTALHYMANANEAPAQEEIVRMLCERGADPDARETQDHTTPLRQQPRPPPAVAAIIRSAHELREGWQRVQAEREQARPAVAAAAVPPLQTKYPGKTPSQIIFEAIKWGREEDVSAVLAGTRDELVNQAVYNEAYCPIDYAVMLGYFASPTPEGADQDRVRRFEYWQSAANSCSMVEMLLLAGERPNRRANSTCVTAIQYAAQSNDTELVLLLLAHGADPSLKDLDGSSALTETRRVRNVQLLEVLNAAQKIREHFQATGRREWPIVVDEPEPEPQDLEDSNTHAYEPQIMERADFNQRMTRIRNECLRISKERGRKNTAKDIYNAGVKCHITAPPNADDLRAAEGATVVDKCTYLSEREAFIEETMEQLKGVDPTQWRDRTLQIKFRLPGCAGVGCSQPGCNHFMQGVDWGGLTKAFIRMMSDCLFDVEMPNALFTEVGKDNDVDGWPSVAGLRRMKMDSKLEKIAGWEDRMLFIGRFVGYCLWTGEVADIPLLPSVYRFLLQQPMQSWRDLALDDPRTFKSFEDVLAMAPEELETLCYAMCYTDADDPRVEIPLVTGTSAVDAEDVTVENRLAFVELSSDVIMRGRCTRGLAQLQQGFHSIVPLEMIADVGGVICREGLSAYELQLMVCGKAEINVGELRSSTLYKNCDMATKECTWFFEVLEGWQSGNPMWETGSDDQVKVGPDMVGKVVEFVTGTNRSPPGGWKNLRDKAGKKCHFTIYHNDDASQRCGWPRSHTCFNKIDLPEYERREQLAQNLHGALKFGMGFGDA
eukprot:COSAG05_NODE_13_length_36464_cov_294.169449_22_plen_855_part_00